MARTRTTKKIAQRIDLNYFQRPTPLKRVRLWLAVLVPMIAMVWIASRGWSRDARVYSSGRLSEAHAVLERECAACHVRTTGGFSAKAEDRACLACHDGPGHHPVSTPAGKLPSCATCHLEHRGRVRLASVRNAACAECHGSLGSVSRRKTFAGAIRSFEDGHPEFAAVRSLSGQVPGDARTIKLNHAVHMEPIRRSPTGPMVQLECGNCHHAAATAADLTYSDATYRAANVSYREADVVLPLGSVGLKAAKPLTGREYMEPVKFANACAACHRLTFDQRFDFGVPHDTPQAIGAFLIATFTNYIRTHPAELRQDRERQPELTGRVAQPAARTYTVSSWVAERVNEAEQLLWRKTCKQCHTLSIGLRQDNLPVVDAAKVTAGWMPHAKFDHDAHRGFTCESCHAKALTSNDDAEILLPGIATCQKCHAPGPEHASSRCSECHTYHDWSKRTEVTPRFTLHALVPAAAR